MFHMCDCIITSNMNAYVPSQGFPEPLMDSFPRLAVPTLLFSRSYPRNGLNFRSLPRRCCKGTPKRTDARLSSISAFIRDCRESTW